MATTRPHKEVSPRVKLMTLADMTRAGHGSPRTIWRKVADGTLPKPFRFGKKAVWREATIIARIDAAEKAG